MVRQPSPYIMKIITTNCPICKIETGSIDIHDKKNKWFRKDRQNLCSRCLSDRMEYSKNLNRQRMLTNNPMADETVRNRVSNTLKKRYKLGEIKSAFQDKEKLKIIQLLRGPIRPHKIEEMSLRMKINNPMKNVNIRRKVSDTIHRKISSGEITYKRGHEHILYKGTRNFSNDCRKRLRGWIKSIMVRDNFTCTVCGVSGGYLHTHHIRPLRNIIKTIFTQNKIKKIEIVKSKNINQYEKLIQMVVDEHKMEDGITVCKQCHANIDDRYRRIKKTI